MVKKSLKPKRKIFEKIDRAFHTGFFDKEVKFNDFSLEVLVEESIEGNMHNMSIRGNYMKPGRSIAFKRIQDGIHWTYGLPLAEEYAGGIAASLDTRVYTAEANDKTIVVKAKFSKEDIQNAIHDYVKGVGGYLTQTQFMELTGASEAQLVKVFRTGHNTICNRQYSADDILRFSRRGYKELVVETVYKRRFFETKENQPTNIMNIYRKILDYSAPKHAQGRLFGQ